MSYSSAFGRSFAAAAGAASARAIAMRFSRGRKRYTRRPRRTRARRSRRRSYRRRRTTVARKVNYGVNKFTAPAKQSEVVPSTGVLLNEASNTLYQLEAIQISRGISTIQRERNAAYVGGIKLNASFTNLAYHPVWLNVAIVGLTSGLGATTVQTENFFRACSIANERGADFNAPSQGDDRLKNWPINSDLYKIIRHKRYLLKPRYGTITANTVPDLTGSTDNKGTTPGLPNTGGFYNTDGISQNYRTVKWYVPIKRTILFGDSNASSVENKLFIVWWVHDFQGPANTAVSDTIRRNLSVCTFFRDVM